VHCLFTIPTCQDLNHNFRKTCLYVPEHRHSPTRLHGVTTQKSTVSSTTAVKTYKTYPSVSFLPPPPIPFFYLVCEAVGTVATPGLLCQPRMIVKMIVEKQMEC
jgi:hypothetical protein